METLATFTLSVLGESAAGWREAIGARGFSAFVDSQARLPRLDIFVVNAGFCVGSTVRQL